MRGGEGEKMWVGGRCGWRGKGKGERPRWSALSATSLTQTRLLIKTLFCFFGPGWRFPTLVVSEYKLFTVYEI